MPEELQLIQHSRIVNSKLLVQTSPGPNFSLASPNKLGVQEKCNITPCIRYIIENSESTSTVHVYSINRS
jgi:hypothetical protein